LTASGEREELSARHAAYFLDVATRMRSVFVGMALAEWLAGIAPLMDDFRAVLQWALLTGSDPDLGRGRDPALGGAVAAALEAYWWHGGGEAEGRRWIELALRQINQESYPEIVSQLRRGLNLLTSRMLYS
jgi:hypothetical protein